MIEGLEKINLIFKVQITILFSSKVSINRICKVYHKFRCKDWTEKCSKNHLVVKDNRIIRMNRRILLKTNPIFKILKSIIPIFNFKKGREIFMDLIRHKIFFSNRIFKINAKSLMIFNKMANMEDLNQDIFSLPKIIKKKAIRNITIFIIVKNQSMD